MIKTILTALTLCLFGATVQAQARETITIYFNAGANQPNYAPYLKTIAIANQLQNRYQFQMELKPGANGVLALKAMDQSPENSLATQAPAFVENARSGAINERDYVAVAAQGDACWAVITNLGDSARGIESLRGQKEITVGGTGFGNVAHLTALTLGERYGFDVRYIVYKANYDALLNMAAGEKINFVIERVQNYQTFRAKNPNLQILGMSCEQRHPAALEVRTLREQGVSVPSIFFVTLANVKMPESKRRDIERIFEQAQQELGQDALIEQADLQAPQFRKPPVSAQKFFEQRTGQIKNLLTRYNTQIERAKTQ